MHSWTRVKFLLTVNLLLWIIHILICSVYPMQKVYFLKRYHQKRTVKWVLTKQIIRVQSWFHLMQHRLTLTQILPLGKIYISCCQVIGKFLPQNYVHCLVFLVGKFVMLEWNVGHWKLNMIFHSGRLQKVINYFQKSIILLILPFRSG